jgi:Domain of unknown function (DUF4160)
MPEISRFYDDHSPPHFHAFYGKDEAKFNISTHQLIEGYLPKNAIRLVKSWAAKHKVELMENWKRSRKPSRLEKIQPLQ